MEDSAGFQLLRYRNEHSRWVPLWHILRHYCRLASVQLIEDYAGLVQSFLICHHLGSSIWGQHCPLNLFEFLWNESAVRDQNTRSSLLYVANGEYVSSHNHP